MKKIIYFKCLTLILLCWVSLNLNAQCPSPVTVTGTTGTWVNTSGKAATVQIVAKGADGGKNTTTFAGGATNQNGGSGATIQGNFTVAAGATLFIIAGTAGGTTARSGGGGGGSGVVNCGNPSNCGTGTILLIAGGGGGTAGFGNGGGGVVASGTGAGGIVLSSSGAGGGGLNANGGDANVGVAVGSGGGQVSKTAASTGGTPQASNGAGGTGMGGGGGGVNSTAAGGGGYTGGSGEKTLATTAVAGGGTSFNTGTSQSNTAGGVSLNSSTAGTVTVTCLSVLPVELLYIAAFTEEDKIKLSWATGVEINNDAFIIERSQDGKTFTKIGTVKAQGKASDYAFMDNTPFSTNYYRLRQIDFDGTETLSKVVSVELKGKGKGLTVYPTLVSNGILTVDTEGGQLRDFSVMNLLGQQVLVGKTTTQIDVSALAKGTYMLKVGSEVAKFVKQ
jgi:Secretion system C-terminal sorting domain